MKSFTLASEALFYWTDYIIYFYIWSVKRVFFVFWLMLVFKIFWVKFSFFYVLHKSNSSLFVAILQIGFSCTLWQFRHRVWLFTACGSSATRWYISKYDILIHYRCKAKYSTRLIQRSGNTTFEMLCIKEWQFRHTFI